jgi:aminoglycoside phosphotransferase family enzyme
MPIRRVNTRDGPGITAEQLEMNTEIPAGNVFRYVLSMKRFAAKKLLHNAEKKVGGVTLKHHLSFYGGASKG